MVWWDANLKVIKERCKGEIADIAVKLDLHRTSLSRKINGHIPFTRWEIRDLAEILHCDESDLIIDKSPSKGKGLTHGQRVGTRSL